jgi:hypothetical protein
MPTTIEHSGRSTRTGAVRWCTGRVLHLLRHIATVVLVAALAGCSNDGVDTQPAQNTSPTIDESKPHTHGPGNEHISSLVGDGTRDYEVGYTLTDVSLPKKAAAPGYVRFQIKSYDGQPLTDYIPEQTKDLHLYLIRADLSGFRHLHPTLGRDGTWSAPVTLPEPGDYRVIAEFVARDDGGNGDHVMLGKTETVPGSWTPDGVDASTVGDDGIVSVEVERDLAAGPSGRLDILARDAQGRPVKVGSYLGTFAHMTGFHLQSGGVVHMHPLGQPEVDDTATRLSFHTQFDKVGEYVCFVQLRVDGFLHTIPVTVDVA